MVAACGSNPDSKLDASGGGAGDGQGGGGDGNGSGSAQNCGELTVTLRDFQIAHPDMQGMIGVDRGLVRVDLGVDDKPVYAPTGMTTTVSGQTSFDARARARWELRARRVPRRTPHDAVHISYGDDNRLLHHFLNLEGKPAARDSCAT